MGFENVEEKMAFGAATFDAGESVKRWVVSGMARALSMESNGANLEHLSNAVDQGSGLSDESNIPLLMLRRHEAVELNISHLQQREDHWAIVDLIGKAAHI
jgi:hypothetical protein